MRSIALINYALVSSIAQHYGEFMLAVQIWFPNATPKDIPNIAEAIASFPCTFGDEVTHNKIVTSIKNINYNIPRYTSETSYAAKLSVISLNIKVV